jgi:hypothetical protein
MDWGTEIGVREGEADTSGAADVAVVAVELGSGWNFSIVGGRSVVECLPTVQGWIERNSSKVKTRGLQHFQPVRLST